MRFIRVDKDNNTEVINIEGSASDYIYDKIKENKDGYMNGKHFFDNYFIIYNDGLSEYDCGDFYVVKAPNKMWDCYDEPLSLSDEDIEKIVLRIKHERY